MRSRKFSINLGDEVPLCFIISVSSSPNRNIILFDRPIEKIHETRGAVKTT